MILNLGSAIFNAETATGGGTPAWGTEMGQGEGYKFSFEDDTNLITSLVYNSEPNPQQRVTCPLGKGGKAFNDYEFVICGHYTKVFVNGTLIPDAQFDLLVVKKLVGANHVGRRTLKYNPRITLDGNSNNAPCYNLMGQTLGVTSNGSWFISEINTLNQDELHFTAHILDKDNHFVFRDSAHRFKVLSSFLKDNNFKEVVKRSTHSEISDNEPLQQIYFGAPGTGKSHRIKQACSNHEHYRITFHPDTDYTSFVGSYKPITLSEQVYTNMGDKAIPLKDSVTGEPVTTTKITYQYVYQAFLNAYIAAWKQQQSENPQPVFLVIEEINRGNCAQIFGDIFQLLDRNESGFSDYPIIADNDLKKELAKEFATLEVANADAINSLYDDDIVVKIKSGSHLLLPNNLYIWATMNTSDQSLFPIDSAFKRRWEWKYVKIADSGKNYRIAVNGNEYDWWEFVNAINSHIGTDTDQEDKKLGYFFAKAKKNDEGKYIISADTFLSKVIFFIYNDVYKDFGFDNDLFKDENGEELTFANYFDQYGDTVPEKVERFIQNLDLKPIETIEDFDIEENSADETEKKSNMTPIEGIKIGNSIDIHANGKNAINFFVDFLKLVGLQRVSEFTELKRGTFPVVVCSETNPNERYYRKSEEVNGVNYFIHTHNGNDEKRKLINMIANKFYPGETIFITPDETID